MATAATENDLDVFARVIDGEITEYPVYRLHIKNRSHPMAWYTPVVDGVKPELPEFHYYVKTLSIFSTYVQVDYAVAPYSLNDLLGKVYRDAGIGPFSQEVLDISKVPPATIERVYILGGAYATAKLDVFAQTRKYDSITALCSYSNSSFEKFKTEAARGVYLRDLFWQTFVTFFEKVVTGVLPVPRSTAEIDAILPDLTWEDPVVETPSASEAPVEVPVVEVPAETPAETPVVEEPAPETPVAP